MHQDFKPYIQHVKGNTYCITMPQMCIPLYRLDANRAIMLDSGLPRDWPVIEALLDQEGLTVVAVLTSHGHPDHIGNHMNLRRRFGTQVYMSYFTAAVHANPMNRLAGWAALSTYRKVKKYMIDNFAPDHLLDWTAPSVTVDGVTFQILQLDGHDAEHMGFVTPDNVVYLGDCVLSEHVIRALRTAYCVCIERDLETKEYVAGLRYDKYILAHGGVYDEIRYLAELNRDVFLEKARLIESLAGEPVTLDQLTVRFMEATGSDLTVLQKVHGTQRNVKAFVDYLLDNERLSVCVIDGMLHYTQTKK